MKKLGKLQINSDKLMKDEELMTLRGGYGSYKCYHLGTGGGWCNGFIGYINTASCGMAWDICNAMGGSCVCDGDCAPC